jgi:REP element-mobilizing transposase RayT
LLVNYPPKVRLSELVNSLKGVSSRRNLLTARRLAWLTSNIKHCSAAQT